MNKTIIRVRREAIFGDTLSFYAAQDLGGTRFAFHKPVEWTATDVESALMPDTPPLLTLKTDEAQSLIDELWHHGIRPSEGHGSTGQLAATEKHLDHTSKLLDQTLQTVLNVANASLLTQHSLKPAES